MPLFHFIGVKDNNIICAEVACQLRQLDRFVGIVVNFSKRISSIYLHYSTLDIGFKPPNTVDKGKGDLIQFGVISLSTRRLFVDKVDVLLIPVSE